MLVAIHISSFNYYPLFIRRYLNYNSDVVSLENIENSTVLKKLTLIILSDNDNFVKSKNSDSMGRIIEPVAIKILSVSSEKERGTIDFSMKKLIA